MILHLRAVIAQYPHFFGQPGIIRHHRPAIAQGTQVFARIEAKPRRVAQSANPPTPVTRPMRLCCVFDHLQAMSSGNGVDRVHISRLPVQMHGNDRFGLWGYRRFDQGWVNVVSPPVWLHRHWRGPGIADRQPSGNVGVRWHDDLVTRPNAVGA